MKHKIFIAAMAIAALLLPMEINAKGKPASVPLLKDANGVTIGRVIGMDTVGWPYVLTDRGYHTLFRLGTGMIYINAGANYESIDCTGVAYQGSARYLGAVFSPALQDTLAYAAGAILYSPGDAKRVTVDINSSLDGNLDCVPYVFPDYSGYPAYPNDPEITGINNTVYPTRMIIE